MNPSLQHTANKFKVSLTYNWLDECISRFLLASFWNCRYLVLLEVPQSFALCGKNRHLVKTGSENYRNNIMVYFFCFLKASLK